MVDVQGYLQDKGLILKPATKGNVHTSCFFCSETSEQRGRLYINVSPDADIPGLFQCKICDARGSLTSIKRHFGDEIEKKDEDVGRLSDLYNFAADFYHDNLIVNEDALKYLRGDKRNLEVATISEFKIGYAEGGLYKALREANFGFKEIMDSGLIIEDKESGRKRDSLLNMVAIPYFVAGNCVGIRGRAWPYDPDSKSPKYKTCGGTQARLFNTDVVWEQEEVFVVEGEFNAMVLHQLGFNAVGLPGAGAWQDSWDGYLDDMRRIWAIFDEDTAGDAGAAKLRDKFGPRVKRIKLYNGSYGVDVTDWVGAGNVASDVEDAKREASRGGLLVTVDEAWQEHSELQGMSGLRLGIEQLDFYLDPGLLASQVMVIIAKTNSGKTVSLLNMMHRMRLEKKQKDLKVLFISLEQTRGDWWERARRIHRFYNINATDSDALDFWRNNMVIIDKNRVGEDELLAALDDYEYNMGSSPDIVFIDYLGYWARSFKGEAYERTSAAIMSLKSIAKDRRLAIVTPHQISRGTKNGEEPDLDAARDSGTVEETADFVLSLWSQDNLLGRADEERSGVVSMRLLKSRHGGKGAKFDLQFAPLSLAMIPMNGVSGDDPLLQRARDEMRYAYDYKDKWPTAVYRHRTGHQGILSGEPGFQESML